MVTDINRKINLDVTNIIWDSVRGPVSIREQSCVSRLIHKHLWNSLRVRVSASIYESTRKAIDIKLEQYAFKK